MGRNQGKDRKQSGNKHKPNITKNKKQFKNAKQTNRSIRPKFSSGKRSQKQIGRQNNKNNKKSQKKNLGQFSHLVGKSLFQMVPDRGDDDQEDKFAALNNQNEEEQQNYQQVQVGSQQNIQEYDQNGVEDEGQYQEQDENLQQNENNQFDGNIQQQNEEYQENGQLQEQAVEQQNQQQIDGQGQVAQGANQQEDDKNVDISVINLKIQQTLQVLMNLPKLGEGKSRKYYVDKLKSYVHRYYGYNFELIDHFLNFLNPTEMIQFFQANQTQRPLTIRTNTLRTRRKQLAQALIQRGVNLDPLAEWSKVGIKIYETKVPIGATPQYLAGHYMLQSASSFLPVLALDPQMNQKVLDMASAPGGKTSYIAQIMKNTGAIFANDLKKDRLRALQYNIFRLGITNTVVTCRDGRKYPQIFPNTFDRVLLDAPCTGLGIISKDFSIKSNRVLLDIYKNSHVQKQLLLAAIDCTKVGGVIVYSTCSVSPLQNQQVINYALKKRHVKIVDIDDLVQVGEPGLTKFIDKRYHVDLRKTKRIYPHVHNMDGFYLGKLVKIANGKKLSDKQGKDEQQK